MAHFSPNDFKFYGLTTAGERGQIVIPKEVRAAMKIDNIIGRGAGNGDDLIDCIAVEVHKVIRYKASDLGM